jgi:hypothetical protein
MAPVTDFDDKTNYIPGYLLIVAQEGEAYPVVPGLPISSGYTISAG